MVFYLYNYPSFLLLLLFFHERRRQVLVAIAQHLVPEELEGQVQPDLLLVERVLGVLLEGDELRHPARALEQGDEEDEAEGGPVEDVAGGRDAEEVVADPDRLL